MATFDLKKGIIIKTNVSDFAIRAYLSQLDRQGKLRLVAYYLQKISIAELNYDIYNKELLAIIEAF